MVGPADSAAPPADETGPPAVNKTPWHQSLDNWVAIARTPGRPSPALIAARLIIAYRPSLTPGRPPVARRRRGSSPARPSSSSPHRRRPPPTGPGPGLVAARPSHRPRPPGIIIWRLGGPGAPGTQKIVTVLAPDPVSSSTSCKPREGHRRRHHHHHPYHHLRNPTDFLWLAAGKGTQVRGEPTSSSSGNHRKLSGPRDSAAPSGSHLAEIANRCFSAGVSLPDCCCCCLLLLNKILSFKSIGRDGS